jgi:hypothetical protein
MAAAVAALVGALSIAATSHATAQEIPFSKARLFFELNDTDGDLGLHAEVDGDPWKRLLIEDPHERVILSVLATGRLRRQGMTEITFESAEPAFDELPPAEFFARFPEGVYEFEAITLEGGQLESESELSHVLPAPVDDIRINGLATPPSCDEGARPSVTAGADVMISWNPVTSSHPDLGQAGAVRLEEYEVALERGDLVMSVRLPPTVLSYTVPGSLIVPGDEGFKLEVLARADNGNRTAVETCFDVD